PLLHADALPPGYRAVGEGTCLSKIMFGQYCIGAHSSRGEPRGTNETNHQRSARWEEAHMSVSNIFNIFIRHLDVPGKSRGYRGDNGNIVVYETRAEAEAVA